METLTGGFYPDQVYTKFFPELKAEFVKPTPAHAD
jgi:hypothetical protein